MHDWNRFMPYGLEDLVTTTVTDRVESSVPSMIAACIDERLKEKCWQLEHNIIVSPALENYIQNMVDKRVQKLLSAKGFILGMLPDQFDDNIIDKINEKSEGT